MCLRMILSAASVFAALSATAAFDAATYYVDAVGGSDSNDGTSPEKAKATIQAMYNAAAANSTIVVYPGVYSNDVGRGLSSDHWWGRSRLHLGSKSMRIVSKDGAAATHIVGKLGPTGGYGLADDYDSAVRCIDVEMKTASGTEIVVEGFTLRDGATRDKNELCPGGGAAVLCTDGDNDYPKSFALVDCVITNCYGAFSTVCGGSVVRCRMEGNEFYRNAGGAMPSSFYRSNVINSRYSGNRATDRNDRTQPIASCVNIHGQFANVTFVNNRHMNNSFNGTKYYSCIHSLSHFSPDDGCSEDNDGCSLNHVVDTVDSRSLVAPTAGDIRIRSGSVAETAGRVDALADETLFPLPSGVDRFRDIHGNVIPSNAAAICAGASQTVVEPPCGAICATSADVSFDGVDLPHSAPAWIYPMSYPSSVRLNAVTKDGSVFRRFDLSDSGYRDTINGSSVALRQTRLPVRGDGDGWNSTWLIPPRSKDSVLTVKANYESSNVRWCDPAADAEVADGTAEKPYRTIQAAIDSIASSGLVLLRPGTYSEGCGTVNDKMKARVTFGSKNITVRGLAGAGNTVVTGAADPDTGTFGPGATLLVALNSSAQVQGVTLTGGYSGDAAKWQECDGRGAIYSYGRDLELVDCIITNNVGKNFALGTARFERCLISGNVGGTGLAVDPIFVSCIIGGNTVTDSSKAYLGDWNAYVTKLYSTTFIGDGTRPIWGSGSSLADFAVNCVIDRGYGSAAFSKGGVNGCVMNGFASGGSGYVAADPMLCDADALDVRLFSQSPARSAARIPQDGEIGESWWYVCPTDFYGNPWQFDEEERFAAGAVQEVRTGGVYVSRGEGVTVISGGKAGYNELSEGETLTVGFAAGSTLPVAGFVVNGVTNLFTESMAETPTLSVSGADVAVMPLYSSTWWVDSVNGSDTDGLGYNAANAFRTLAAALSNPNLAEGQTVMALPGTYREGTMIQDSSRSVRARGVVPRGVTLASRDGAAVTCIEGAPATTVDSASSEAYRSVMVTGMGRDAIRGLYLKEYASVCGFTISNCFTRGASDAGESLHYNPDACGAGVASPSERSYVSNCVLTCNTAFRGGGTFLATSVNCIFDGNTALYGGGATTDAKQYGCLTRNNSCVEKENWGGFFYCKTVDSCTVLDSLGGAGNRGSHTIVNSLILGRLGDWDEGRVGTTNFANCCFASDVGGNIAHSSYRPSIADGTGNIIVPLAELPVDADGRPLAGNAAIDRADESLSAFVGGCDLLGGQRVYNGARDVGALEADWRPVYAKDISGRLAVLSASPNVVETESNLVRLVDSTSLSAALRTPNAAGRAALVRVAVTGDGTLSVCVNGETADTLSAGESVVRLPLAGTGLEEISFAYSGNGHADIGRMSLENGFRVILR